MGKLSRSSGSGKRAVVTVSEHSGLLIFYPLWVSQLLPLILAGQKIVYSICILDLCLIMPAFIIIAIMTTKNGGLGLLLTPASFVKGFALLISVALGAIVAPLYHQTGDMAQMWFYLCLSTVFLVLTVVHLKDLKIGGETA